MKSERSVVQAHQKRRWKLELIEGMNLHWRDLYADIAPERASGSAKHADTSAE